MPPTFQSPHQSKGERTGMRSVGRAQTRGQGEKGGEGGAAGPPGLDWEKPGNICFHLAQPQSLSGSGRTQGPLQPSQSRPGSRLTDGGVGRRTLAWPQVFWGSLYPLLPAPFFSRGYHLSPTVSSLTSEGIRAPSIHFPQSCWYLPVLSL